MNVTEGKLTFVVFLSYNVRQLEVQSITVILFHHYVTSCGTYLTVHCSVTMNPEMIFSMTLKLIWHSSLSSFIGVFLLLSVYSECNYKVLLQGSPEADQGQARSCRGSGTVLCVCVCVGAGGGRR